MSKNIESVFTKEMEVPEIVKQRAEEAFVRIRTEKNVEEREAQNMIQNKLQNQKQNKNRNRNMYRKGSFGRHAAALAAGFVLAAGGITAVAATYQHWSRGAGGALLSTEDQQVRLDSEGFTGFYEEEVSGNVKVTSAGITVRPVQTITDRYFSILSFSVEGYELPDGEEPGFERITVKVTDREGTEYPLNMSASFYDGILTGDDGKPVYENGKPLESDENGRLVEYYKDEDGKLEYVMYLSLSDAGDTLVGKHVLVGFENLGTLYKAEYENRVSGEWSFDVELSGKDAGVIYEPDARLGESGAVVETVELSPISVRVEYDFPASQYMETAVDGEGHQTQTVQYREPPIFAGVKLKDGTLLPYIRDGGSMGYTDETLQTYETIFAFNRVIDVTQVEAVLFWREVSGEASQLTEENFHVVPIG